ARRQGADVEVGDVGGGRRLLDPPADDVELTLEVLGAGLALDADDDLLDLRPRRVGLLADDRDVHRNLAPAIDGVAELEDLLLDDAAAALLAVEVGARQEDLADGEVAVVGLVSQVSDMRLEEVLG